MSDQATEIKERGILFSGEMVRALLDGSKTQTRRVIKPSKRDAEGICIIDDRYPYNLYGEDITDHDGVEWPIVCPYARLLGDRLWVRETWRQVSISYADEYMGQTAAYRADQDKNYEGAKWRPSIHMPRWASRITLEVTGVRVERVQEIGTHDAIVEGVFMAEDAKEMAVRQGIVDGAASVGPVEYFRELWDSINAKRGYSWESNPWVWAIAFKKIEP